MSDGGLYLISHIASMRCYAGCTNNLERRFAYHRTRLNNGRHHNVALQGDWLLYGADGFKFEVVSRFQSAKEFSLRHRDEKALIASCDPLLSYNLLSEAVRRKDSDGLPLKHRVLKLNAEQWAAFDDLGGMEWLRKLIDRARPK